MFTYSTNWMGPINTDWIKKHGDCWSAGRIDVCGGSDYPDEYSLPPMHSQDWERLSAWLDGLETEKVWSFVELITEFEKHHPPIKWLRKDTCDND